MEINNQESAEMRKARVLKQLMRENIRPANPDDWAEREDRAMLRKVGKGWGRLAQF